jgi:hypothetical protein
MTGMRHLALVAVAVVAAGCGAGEPTEHARQAETGRAASAPRELGPRYGIAVNSSQALTVEWREAARRHAD